MSKAKAAAMVLAVIISLLAGCLLIATSASSGNNIKDDAIGLAKIENRQLSNNAATITSTESLSTDATNTTAAKRSTATSTTTVSTTVTTAPKNDVSVLSATITDTAVIARESKHIVIESKIEAVTEASTQAQESTTEATTTSMQATEAATTAQKPALQPATEPKTEPVTVTQEPTTVIQSTTQYIEPTTANEEKKDASVQENVLPISDQEYILLCNAVAHEAGSNWIDVYEKGKVVEVIMNRVESPLYPNTIYGVLTAPYQFTGAYGYADLTDYSWEVTDMVKEAVTLYFTEPESFQHGYFFFTGDGYMNHFR